MGEKNKTTKNKDIASRLDLTQKDIQTITQKIIDLPKIQPYYHNKELPERSPLIIVENKMLSKNIKLKKFGKPVTIINEINKRVKNKAYLILNFTFSNRKKASINFRYPIEGIEGKIEFELSNDLWIVTASELIER